MATVWAKSNGNWTDTTLWAYWKESTQQIEDYGQTPQVDDVVYCDGRTITINDINVINVNSINNSQNPHTGYSGGRLNKTSGTSIQINANINAISQIVYYAVNSSRSIVIRGDVFATGANALGLGAYNNFNCYINGNVTINGAALVDDGLAIGSLTINGNVISVSSSISYFGVQGGNSNFTVTVNGNVSDVYYHTSNNGNIYINGVFTSHTNTNLQAANLTINGGIEYVSTNYKNGGVTPNNLLGTIYFWRDITPNSNAPFRRITKYQLDNTDQYPSPANVKDDVPYAWGEKVGTYSPDYPPETVVLKDYVYDNGNMTGNMSATAQVGCVTKEDVREGVALLGMGEVGTLVVPSVDDVREGVVFDNGSVGTLIVQGGGDRLRIANFGYYTNAQSDTYIVDLTEQDKPKFAVAEERVLIEKFPDLDLENIPDKYFDDLFVKYLKYRLIVEYYRTAGINSTFTPSEPTTEIVNYQNVRNEVWLNSANIYLKAWAKKYPESIMKPQRILL